MGQCCSRPFRTAYITCEPSSLWSRLPVSFTKPTLLVCNRVRLRLPNDTMLSLWQKPHSQHMCLQRKGRESKFPAGIRKFVQIICMLDYVVSLLMYQSLLSFMNASASLPKRCFEQGTALCLSVERLNAKGNELQTIRWSQCMVRYGPPFIASLIPPLF